VHSFPTYLSIELLQQEEQTMERVMGFCHMESQK